MSASQTNVTSLTTTDLFALSLMDLQNIDLQDRVLQENTLEDSLLEDNTLTDSMLQDGVASSTLLDLFALSLMDLEASLPRPSPEATPLHWGDATVIPSNETIAAPIIAPSKQPSFFNRRTGALAGAAIATVAGTSLIRLADQPATFEGKFQLVVEPAVNPTALKTQASAADQASNPAMRAVASLDYATQREVLWSPKLLSPVVQKLQAQYADLTYETLSQKLDIAHRDGEASLEVTYQDPDSQKVQAVLQTVSQAYLQYSQECRSSLCRELTFVERRLPHLREQVSIAQQNLQQLQQQHGITEPTAMGQQLAQRSSVIIQQRQTLQIRLIEARTQLAIVQKRAAEQAGQPQSVDVEQAFYQNDRYQALLSQFRAIAAQLSVELTQPQPDATRLQHLKQLYQQVSWQMTEALQQPIMAQQAQALADFQGNKTSDYSQVIRQQTLLEWLTAANQVQMLAVSQQAIVQTEAQLTLQIKQWAGLSRQFDALNLELRFAKDNLNLYETKQAELRQVVQPKTGWQLAEAPMVEQAHQGFTLSDPEHRLSLGLLLSFLLVILVMSTAEQTQSKPRSRRQPAVQPETWQTQPWHLASVSETLATALTVPPPIALSPRYQQTKLFLLTAVTRLETANQALLTKSR